MQRYQPPHARQRQAAVGAAPVPSGSSSTSIHGAAYQPAQNQAGPSPSRPPPVSIRGYAHPQPAYQSDRTPRSKRDWSTPVLASPSSDLRPMRASTPGRTELDEMEMMQSVSRSGGDGAEGDACVAPSLLSRRSTLSYFKFPYKPGCCLSGLFWDCSYDSNHRLGCDLTLA